MDSTLKKKRILITFARSFLTLELSRQLNAQGHDVFVADSLKSPLTSFSNSVRKSYAVPSPRFNPDAYVKSIHDIVIKEKIDLLIPIYEEITYLSKAKDLFPASCTIFSPSFELYEELQHKWLFQEKLKKMGIPTLPAFLINSPQDLSNHEFNKSYALKPCHSRASQRVYKISCASKASSLSYEAHNPWIAQEWATGNKFCTYSVCLNGTLNALSVYPVDFAINGNKCVIFQSVNHPKIMLWITHFVKSTNYTGQIAFDFIETSDGQLYAIECNPRATSGLLLFKPKDGLDKAFSGCLDTPITPLMGRRRQVAMGMLLYGWRKSAKTNNTLSNFLKTFLTTKDVVFRSSDLKPFLFEPLIFGKLWVKSRKLGISLPEFYTYDHDWNGESFKINNTR